MGADLTQQCPSTNVSFWEGGQTPVGNKGGTYCGNELPPVYVGRGPVTILYNFWPLYNTFGFKAKFVVYGNEQIQHAQSFQSLLVDS